MEGHKKITFPGLILSVNSFDKKKPDTIYIEGYLNFKYVKELEVFRHLEKEIKSYLKYWLRNEQTEYLADGLVVVDSQMDSLAVIHWYEGKNSSINFQAYTRKAGRRYDWKETSSWFEKEAQTIYSSICTICKELGLVMQKRERKASSS